jgi:hypothetical protein
MKRIILAALLLGLLGSVSFAQHGRGAMGGNRGALQGRVGPDAFQLNSRQMPAPPNAGHAHGPSAAKSRTNGQGATGGYEAPDAFESDTREMPRPIVHSKTNEPSGTVENPPSQR